MSTVNRIHVLEDILCARLYLAALRRYPELRLDNVYVMIRTDISADTFWCEILGETCEIDLRPEFEPFWCGERTVTQIEESILLTVQDMAREFKLAVLVPGPEGDRWLASLQRRVASLESRVDAMEPRIDADAEFSAESVRFEKRSSLPPSSGN